MNLSTRRIVNVLIAVFLMAIAAAFVYQRINRPRILILHSYDLSYPWVRDINVGLMRALGEKYSYSLRWHYMDLKQHPDPDSRRTAGVTARGVVEQWKPDLIIAVDDDAQDLVTRRYVNHPRIKIVFAGVNGELVDYGFANAKNVTGILERKQWDAYKTALLDIAKSSKLDRAPRLMSIGDNSASLVYDEKNLKKFNWSPAVLTESALVGTYDEWKKAVERAGQKADFIMISNYRKLARSATDPTLVPAREVLQWTETHAKVPVIGTNGFNVEDGGSLAIGVSPFEQGQVAGRMAVDIVDFRKNPAGMPVALPLQFIVAMRATEIAKKNIRLPAVYEAFARGTNNNY